MDTTTLTTYDAHAATFAAAQRAKTPLALQQTVLRWFIPAAPTADLGCGSGRDTAWLVSQGFPAIGYEPSVGMLAEARAAFPHLDLRLAGLPDLTGVATGVVTNLLCSAVLMHLPADQLAPSLTSMARILRPGGRLVLTYRASQAADSRESDGRLYTPIEATSLRALAEAVGLQVLEQATERDGGRPGVQWSVLVAVRKEA